MAPQIDPSSQLEEEVARIAQALDEDVASHLHDADPHDSRKAIKKLRALLRLVRPANPDRLKQAERLYRDAARAVSGARDAKAAVETIDRFIMDFPDEVKRCRLDEIRGVFQARSEHTEASLLESARDEALALRDAARQEVLAVRFDPQMSDGDILKAGFSKTLHKWRKAQKQARGSGDAEDFHELRKVIKALAAQLGLLHEFRKGGFRKHRKKVTELGELLGELNDVHVLRQTLDENDAALPEAPDVGPFAKLLKKHAAALEKQVLRESRRLYGRRPRKLAKLFG
ncbi:CHAD domain-containing protein [Mesorhizobium sp. CAU 1741]|uniref:CHAD domain-containing protein n=1 Tax=Mesorhizobium sp. CAU 1741 TaxID=3140366 RepID=UPI00325C0B1C